MTTFKPKNLLSTSMSQDVLLTNITVKIHEYKPQILQK